MSFIEEIKETKENRLNNEKLVIEEIVGYFEKIINSEDYENKLKYIIKDAINNGKKYDTTRVEFWEHHSGCSNTYFSGGFCRWELADGKIRYNDIRLLDLQEIIGERIVDLVVDKLKTLGLRVISAKNVENRFRYFEKEIIFSW